MIKVFLVGCDFVAAESFKKAVDWYVKMTGIDREEAEHDEAGEIIGDYDKKHSHWDEDTGKTTMVSWNDLIAECKTFPMILASDPDYV